MWYVGEKRIDARGVSDSMFEGLETPERRVEKLEKRVRKIEIALKSIRDSFDTITEIAKNVGKDNEELRKNLYELNKQKKAIQAVDEKQFITLPIKEKIQENIDFIREVASEGFIPEKNSSEKTLLQALKNGALSTDELAKKLHVHRTQIEALAEKLVKKDLIVIQRSWSKAFLKVKK